MSSSATHAIRKCAKCRTAEVQSVGLWGERFEGMYCAGCADAVIAAEDIERDKRLVAAMLREAGETPRMRGFTWTDATCGDIGRDWLERHAAGTAPNLILFGPVGSGKSGLAWMIVRSLCEQKRAALFVNFRNLLADMRLAFAEGSGAVLAAKCARIPVLALDDLGAERPTAWALDELATIVDRRYERQLPTIVTSNYDMNALCKRLSADGADLTMGRRIVSRLVEGAQQVHVDAADRRLAA